MAIANGAWSLKQGDTLLCVQEHIITNWVNCFEEKESDPSKYMWHSNVTYLGDCPVLQMELAREVFLRM